MKRLVRYNGRTYFLNESEQPARNTRSACPAFTQAQLDGMIRDAYVHAKNVAMESYNGNFDTDYPSDSDYATNIMNDLEFTGLTEFGAKFLMLVTAYCGKAVNGPVVYAQYDYDSNRPDEMIAVPCALLPAGFCETGSVADANAVALAVYYNLYAAATGQRLSADDISTLSDFLSGEMDFINTIENMSDVSDYPNDQFGEYIEACWDILYDTDNSSLWSIHRNSPRNSPLLR